MLNEGLGTRSCPLQPSGFFVEALYFLEKITLKNRYAQCVRNHRVSHRARLRLFLLWLCHGVSPLSSLIGWLISPFRLLPKALERPLTSFNSQRSLAELCRPS